MQLLTRLRLLAAVTVLGLPSAAFAQPPSPSVPVVNLTNGQPTTPLSAPIAPSSPLAPVERMEVRPQNAKSNPPNHAIRRPVNSNQKSPQTA